MPGPLSFDPELASYLRIEERELARPDGAKGDRLTARPRLLLSPLADKPTPFGLTQEYAPTGRSGQGRIDELAAGGRN